MPSYRAWNSGDEDDVYIPSYPNRLICDVLSEMRECYKTYNFSPMLGLIEEAQTMANRMEASLSTQKDIRKLEETKSKLVKECKALKKKRGPKKK